MTEPPGRHRNRAGKRLQVARRHIDDEPLDLALAAGLELSGDMLDMPIRPKLRLRHEFVKRALEKTAEVAAHEGAKFLRRKIIHPASAAPLPMRSSQDLSSANTASSARKQRPMKLQRSCRRIAAYSGGFRHCI